jgi:hypothetical protein
MVALLDDDCLPTPKPPFNRVDSANISGEQDDMITLIVDVDNLLPVVADEQEIADAHLLRRGLHSGQL